MEQASLNDLDILAFGNTVQMAGVIYADDKDTHYLAYFPDEKGNDARRVALPLSSADWEKVLRQTDILETEVLAKAGEGAPLTKAIIRKSTRQIEQGVSWRVYARDGYRCRYCGIGDGVPLTVDHLVLWEHGGPSIEANLVSACRKCNKVRGNTLYQDWLKHRHYLDVSRNLSLEVRERNESVVGTLADIPVRLHTRAR